MRAYVVERRTSWVGHVGIVQEMGNWWYFLGLLLVLAVSAFLHFYNLAGFPAPLYDEGVYIQRGIMFKDTGILYPMGRGFYGHPFMGWAFLSFIFILMGFPGATCGGNCVSSPDSLYSFYFAARAVAATFAVVDTLLIYLIAARAWRQPKYGLMAAALFAVTPASVWYFRMVLLDTLMITWVLVAILAALMARERRSPVLAAVSGGMFGLAILTKVPAVFFLPVFIVIFLPEFVGLLGIGRDRHGPRASLLLVIPWLALLVAVGMIWIVYAVVNNQFLYLIYGLQWQAGMVGGYSFPGFMDYFRSIDPLLFFLGFLGVGYAAFRRDLLGLALGLSYVGFLAWLNVRWDFYIAPLVPPLALVGGRFLADAVGFIGGRVPQEVRRPRLAKGSRWAAFVLVVALLALLIAPLPANTAMASRNYSWAPLEGTRYIAHQAPPYSMVITNTVYSLALKQSRPDLWVINWWDSGFNDVLENATHNPAVRQQTITIRSPQAAQEIFSGSVVGAPRRVYLQEGNYVAQGHRFDPNQNQILSSGSVPFHLNKNIALIFLAYYLPPEVLVDRNPARNANGTYTVTLLDPVAMPRYILVDDQARSDAQKIPFLAEVLGRVDPLAVYNNKTEDGVHDARSGLIPMPAGIYRVKAYDRDRFLGSKLVELGASDGEMTFMFNGDQLDTHPQSTSIQPAANPQALYQMRVVVQHSDGQAVPWAWVEVERINALAIFDNATTSAEVRYQPGA